MSTFGEISEPGSRNVWEDWDEGQEIQSQLKWKNENHSPSQITSLYIFEGRKLAHWVKRIASHSLDYVNSIPEVNLNVYKTNENIYLCVINDYSLLLSSEIIELLKPYILVSKDVLLILTKPLVEYQANDYLSQEYILRTISTSEPLKLAPSIAFPKLEQPNIISGVSAGVVSLREMMGLPAAAVICYMEHACEEVNVKELQQLLSNLHFGTFQSQPSSLLNSNLYI